MSPERGDFIEVRWCDTAEDPVGNPEKATLCHRISYGLYWEQRKDGTIDVLVTTTTVDKDSPEQQGYCIYPLANIAAITVIKKKRKPRKRS